MYLILSDSEDQCSFRVRGALEASGFRSVTIANPMIDPARFRWHLDSEVCRSEVEFPQQPPISLDDIGGVLVRSHGWLDPHGWESGDLAYVQAEMQAAMLAWMWSLHCPVINRYPPGIWYRPQIPLLCWQKLLVNCGLQTSEILITNVEQETLALREHLNSKGVVGAFYGPLTSHGGYLVTDEKEWCGLANLQNVAPVCLAEPHGEATLVCVVGERILWRGVPSRDMTRLEPNLNRFAVEAGLDFVELALAPADDSIRVVAVEPQPHFEWFDTSAQQQIVDGLVHLLTTGKESGFC